MKWFWYSLIGFCVLMCSCKTQKLDSNVKGRTDIRSDLAYLNESVKISTQNHAYFANDTQRIVIEEDIVVTEYDKETGKPTKETKTKRKTTQDSDKVVAEEENQAVTNSNQLEVDHSADVSKKIDSEVKEESIGGVNTWLDKATRVGLKLRFEAEQRLGKTETTLWLNGMQFPLPLVGDVTALDMLDGIELYASACYDVTQMHLANIVTLTSVEEVKNYDYLSGYPKKLSF